MDDSKKITSNGRIKTSTVGGFVMPRNYNCFLNTKKLKGERPQSFPLVMVDTNGLEPLTLRTSSESSTS